MNYRGPIKMPKEQFIKEKTPPRTFMETLRGTRKAPKPEAPKPETDASFFSSEINRKVPKRFVKRVAKDEKTGTITSKVDDSGVAAEGVNLPPKTSAEKKRNPLFKSIEAFKTDIGVKPVVVKLAKPKKPKSLGDQIDDSWKSIDTGFYKAGDDIYNAANAARKGVGYGLGVASDYSGATYVGNKIGEGTNAFGTGLYNTPGAIQRAAYATPGVLKDAALAAPGAIKDAAVATAAAASATKQGIKEGVGAVKNAAAYTKEGVKKGLGYLADESGATWLYKQQNMRKALTSSENLLDKLMKIQNIKRNVILGATREVEAAQLYLETAQKQYQEYKDSPDYVEGSDKDEKFKKEIAELTTTLQAKQSMLETQRLANPNVSMQSHGRVRGGKRRHATLAARRAPSRRKRGKRQGKTRQGRRRFSVGD